MDDKLMRDILKNMTRSLLNNILEVKDARVLKVFEIKRNIYEVHIYGNGELDKYGTHIISSFLEDVFNGNILVSVVVY